MKKELKKAIIDFIFEKEKEFQFIKYMGKDIFIYDDNTNESTANQGKRAK